MKSLKHKGLGFVLGVTLISIVLGACSVPGEPAKVGGSVITEPISIDRISIVSVETVPLRLKVHVYGVLPNVCTVIHNISQLKNENRFEIEIVTKRPNNDDCEPGEIDYVEIFELPVKGLKAGRYVVDVNGIEEPFNLIKDNE
jgi:inhibitor of cysteine peptidase